MKVLVIEDEVDLNRSIVKLLKTQQYSVDAAYDGQEALDYIRVSQYDVIISDIMMPQLDGLGVLSYLRNHQIKTPVLMLTAKDSLEDKVTGLDAGADDYLVKPFEFDELLARIRVMLRRNNRENLTNLVQFGDYSLDLAKKTIQHKGVLVDLTSKEYELLECLVRHPNVVLSREQVIHRLFRQKGGWAMFSKMKKDSKSPSIVSKVTLWYTLFVSFLFVLMFCASFIISGAWSSYSSRGELEQKTMEVASDLEEFEPFDDGNYFALYNQNMKLEQGALPSGFDINAGFESGKLSTYTSSQATYYYFDVYNESEGKWIRGVRLASGLGRELSIFFLSLAILAPLSILGMAWGGRRILRKAFLPIREVTQMAEEIAESGDYSKRVSTEHQKDYVETSRLTKVFNNLISSVQSTFEKEKQFNQNVSHELRTPLSVIVSESEFGSKYADNLEETKESLTVIHRQAKLMKSMTEQILEISKTQHLQWSDLKPVCLSTLVSDYCQGQERKWGESPIAFEVSIQPDLWIQGDAVLVTRMLDNLLSNAVKFTKTKVAIHLVASPAGAVLKVADDGIGIAPDHLSKIWDRFYQVEDSRNKGLNSGIGLGLSFIKDIADLHRAEVKIISEEGKGSLFRVTFPQIQDKTSV